MREDDGVSDADAEAVKRAVEGALGGDAHEESAEASTEEVPELIEGKPFYMGHYLGPLGR